MVAPGDPAPGASGAGAVDCGGASARICAGTGAGSSRKNAAAAHTAATLALRDRRKPHPDIAFFLDHKRGIFMPQGARRTGRFRRD
jgi:hypothetical protein